MGERVVKGLKFLEFWVWGGIFGVEGSRFGNDLALGVQGQMIEGLELGHWATWRSMGDQCRVL